MRRAIGLTLDHPRLTALAFVAFLLAAASFLPRLTLVTDGRALFAPDHPALVYQEHVDATYSSADLIVIGIESDDAFTAESFARVRRLTSRLERLPAIEHDGVWSLSTVALPHTADGVLQLTPPADHALTEVRQRVMDEPLFRGRLVSWDGRSAAVYARLDPAADRDAAVDRIEEIVAGEEARERNARYRLLGPAVAESRLALRVLRDIAVLVPVALTAVALLLWFFFRTSSVVLLGLGEGMSTVIGAFAVMAICGVPVTLVSVVMPVILATYCVADTIHVGHRFREKLAGAPSRRAAMEATLDEILRPVVYTSLTTAGGFLSFAFAPIPPLRAFGIFTACGLGVALLVSLFVIPSLLAASGFAPQAEARSGRVARAVDATAMAAARRPLVVVLLFAAAALVFSAGIVRLDIQDRWIDNFDADDPLPRADAWFNRHFFGSNIVNVVLDARGDANDPGFLARAAAVQRAAEARTEVGGSIGYGDQLRAVGRAITGEDRMPLDPMESEQWAMLLESAAGRGAVDPYIDADRQRTNLWLFLNRADYQRTAAVERVVRDAAARENVHVGGFAGDAHLGRVLVGSVARGQQLSVTISILLVFLLVLAMLRSAGAALLTMLPVSLSVVASFGFMGWAGIPLGVATSTFTAIALGVGVDLAIHWLAAVRLARGETAEWESVLARASCSSGRGIAVNAIVVGVGFAVLLFSGVPPVRNLGILMCLNLLVCCAATLVLLPAAATLGRSFRWRSYARPAVAALAIAFSVQAAPRTGDDVMRRVNARELGRNVRMTLRLLLTDVRRGTHERQLELLRSATPTGYRTRFTVTGPKHLEGIVLLLVEEEPKARLWMYFPAGNHITEVATRGLSAMASDFSCEDLRVRFPTSDYEFTHLGTEVVDGRLCHRVDMRPREERLQRELGFSRAIGWVRDDADTIVKADYFDEAGKVFKSFRAEELERVDGIWTLRRYSMVNHRARHRSDVIVTGVDYRATVPAERLAAERLKKVAR